MAGLSGNFVRTGLWRMHTGPIERHWYSAFVTRLEGLLSGAQHHSTKSGQK